MNNNRLHFRLNPVPVSYTHLSANGSTVTISYNYTDTTGTTPVNKTGNMNVTVYDSYDKWLEASTKTPKSYDIADGEAVLIRNTGEMVLDVYKRQL